MSNKNIEQAGLFFMNTMHAYIDLLKRMRATYCCILLCFLISVFQAAIAGSLKLSDWGLRIHHQPPCLEDSSTKLPVGYKVEGTIYTAPVLQKIYTKGLKAYENPSEDNTSTTWFLTESIGALIFCGDQPAMCWSYGKKDWVRGYLNRSFMEKVYVDDYLVDGKLEALRIFFVDCTVNAWLKQPREKNKKPMKLVLCLNRFTEPKPDNDSNGMCLYRSGPKHSHKMFIELDLSKEVYRNLCFDQGYQFDFSPEESYVLVRDKKYPLTVPTETVEIKKESKKKLIQGRSKVTRQHGAGIKCAQTTEPVYRSDTDAVVFACFEPPRVLLNGKSTPWISRFWLIDRNLSESDEEKREKDLSEIKSNSSPEFYQFYNLNQKIMYGEVDDNEIDEALKDVARFFKKHSLDDRCVRITLSTGKIVISNSMLECVNAFLQLLTYYVDKCSEYENEKLNIDLSQLYAGLLSIYPLTDFSEILQSIEQHRMKLSLTSHGEHLKNIYFLFSHLVARFVHMMSSNEEWVLIKKISKACLNSGYALPSIFKNEFVLSELLLQAARHNERDTSYLVSIMALLPAATEIYKKSYGGVIGWCFKQLDKYNKSHRYIWKTLREEKSCWINGTAYASGEKRDFNKLDNFISNVEQMGLLDISETVAWVGDLEEWKSKRKQAEIRKEEVCKTRLEHWDNNFKKLKVRLDVAEKAKAERLRRQRDQPRRKKKRYHSVSAKNIGSIADTKIQEPLTCAGTVCEVEELTIWENQYQIGSRLYQKKEYRNAAIQFKQLLGENDSSQLDDARIFSVLVDCEIEPLRAEIKQLQELSENVKKLHEKLACMAKGQPLIKREKLNRPAAQLSALTKSLHSAMKNAVTYQKQAIQKLNAHLFLTAEDQVSVEDAAVLLTLIEDETLKIQTSLQYMQDALKHLIAAYRLRFDLWRQKVPMSTRSKSRETKMRLTLESEQKQFSLTAAGHTAHSDDVSFNPATGQSLAEDSECCAVKKQDINIQVVDANIKLDLEDDAMRKDVSERISVIDSEVAGLVRELKGASDLREKLVYHQPVPEKALLAVLHSWFDRPGSQAQLMAASHGAEAEKACSPSLMDGNRLIKFAAKGRSLSKTDPEPSRPITEFFEQHGLSCKWGQQDNLGLLSAFASVMCSEEYPLRSFKWWSLSKMPDVESLFAVLGTAAEKLSSAFPAVARLRENASAFTVANPNPDIWVSERLLPYLIVPWSGHQVLVFIDATTTTQCSIRRYDKDGEVTTLALTADGLSFTSENIMLLVKDSKYWAAVLPATRKEGEQ